MRYDRTLLYRLETNAGYVWRAASPAAGLAAAAAAFGAGEPFEELEKPSPTSRLFRSGGLVLRHAEAALADRLERQAEIAYAVRGARLVTPLRSTAGSFVVEAGDGAWLAYRYVDGSRFDGRTCTVGAALRGAMLLLLALGEVDVDTTPLERVRHQPEAWPGALERLAATHELVAGNRQSLAELVQRLAALELSPVLVHDDVNHANVLVVDGAPFFLDIEDLRLEDRRVAAAHAAFKLARHAVYTGAAKREEAAAQAVELVAAETLFDYGAYRILSELTQILDDPTSSYDLDKKVANLFELYDLLRGGPRAK